MPKMSFRKKLGLAVGAVVAFLLLTGAKGKEPPFNDLAQSVVMLTLTNAFGGGTGFIVESPASGKRYILTNWHVCLEPDGTLGERYAARDGEFSEIRVKPIDADEAHDLCLMEPVPGRVIPLGEDPHVRFQEIYTLGHPLLRKQTAVTGRFTGYVLDTITFMPKADGKCLPGMETLDTLFGVYCQRKYELFTSTLQIAPGNSGSPVVDAEGKLLGIINSGEGGTGYGGAVSVKYVKFLLERH